MVRNATRRARSRGSGAAAGEPSRERTAVAAVVVRPSAIPGAGAGVFATAPLAPGAVLGRYEGVRVDPREARGDYALLMTVRGARPFAIDASDPHASNWTRYVNSTRPGDGAVPNVRFAAWRGSAFVQAVRAIAPGEELLLDYGPEYDWSGAPPVAAPHGARAPPKVGARQ
jgi:SET domain-containing protein